MANASGFLFTVPGSGGSKWQGVFTDNACNGRKYNHMASMVPSTMFQSGSSCCPDACLQWPSGDIPSGTYSYEGTIDASSRSLTFYGTHIATGMSVTITGPLADPVPCTTSVSGQWELTIEEPSAVMVRIMQLHNSFWS